MLILQGRDCVRSVLWTFVRVLPVDNRLVVWHELVYIRYLTLAQLSTG
jgi:hypothetical protein